MLITDKMSLHSFEFLFPSLSLIGAFYTGCAVQPVVLKYPNRLVSKYNKNKLRAKFHEAICMYH